MEEVLMVTEWVVTFRSIVRLTSPKLNYLIIAGSLLMYLSVYVQLLYTTNKAAIHAQCIVSTYTSL